MPNQNKPTSTLCQLLLYSYTIVARIAIVTLAFGCLIVLDAKTTAMSVPAQAIEQTKSAINTETGEDKRQGLEDVLGIQIDITKEYASPYNNRLLTYALIMVALLATLLVPRVYRKNTCS
jgi:hypothetical protein